MNKIIAALLLTTATATAADLPRNMYASQVEEDAMDYETCAEIAGDIAEHAKMEQGYRIASERYDDRRRQARVVIVHTDGRPSGEVICRNGRIRIIEWRQGR